MPDERSSEEILNYETPRRALHDPDHALIPIPAVICLWLEVLAGAFGWVSLANAKGIGEESLQLYLGFLCYLICGILCLAVLAQAVFMMVVRRKYAAGIKAAVFSVVIVAVSILLFWN